MTDDLDVIEPQSRVVDYRGERVEVRPLKVRQIPGFLRVARPVLSAVFAGGPVELTPERVMDLLAEHGEPLTEAAAIAVDRPVDWIADGDSGEFIGLVMAVLAVNLDFFARRLAPEAQRLLAVWDGAGQTPFSPSSEPATH